MLDRVADIVPASRSDLGTKAGVALDHGVKLIFHPTLGAFYVRLQYADSAGVMLDVVADDGVADVRFTRDLGTHEPDGPAHARRFDRLKHPPLPRVIVKLVTELTFRPVR